MSKRGPQGAVLTNVWLAYMPSTLLQILFESQQKLKPFITATIRGRQRCTCVLRVDTRVGPPCTRATMRPDTSRVHASYQCISIT